MFEFFKSSEKIPVKQDLAKLEDERIPELEYSVEGKNIDELKEQVKIITELTLCISPDNNQNGHFKKIKEIEDKIKELESNLSLESNQEASPEEMRIELDNLRAKQMDFESDFTKADMSRIEEIEEHLSGRKAA